MWKAKLCDNGTGALLRLSMKSCRTFDATVFISNRFNLHSICMQLFEKGDLLSAGDGTVTDDFSKALAKCHHHQTCASSSVCDHCRST